MSKTAQYNHDNMPMKDIMSEIRDMVSRETQARYDANPSEPQPKLLVLRPESRVKDPPTPPAPVTAKELKDSLEEDVFRIKLRETFGIAEASELAELIRKVLREELNASR